jgi:cytoskeletal protein CcmA (bactofilin family)
VGVFSKTNKGTSQAGATIIAKGTCIIGGISTEGTVHIDGKFEGVILEADAISIGKTGEVIGDIKANHVVISGFFDGKIDCNIMQVMSSGKVIGDFTYNDLIIEEDAKFEGKVNRKNSELKSRYNEIENRIGGFVSTKEEDISYANPSTEKIK